MEEKKWLKDKYGVFELIPLQNSHKYYKQYNNHEDDMNYRYTECHNRDLLFSWEEIMNNPQIIYAQ